MTTGDKGKLFILFVPFSLLSFYSASLCARCGLYVNQKQFLQSSKRPRYELVVIDQQR